MHAAVKYYGHGEWIIVFDNLYLDAEGSWRVFGEYPNIYSFPSKEIADSILDNWLMRDAKLIPSFGSPMTYLVKISDMWLQPNGKLADIPCVFGYHPALECLTLYQFGRCEIGGYKMKIETNLISMIEEL